MKPYLSLGEAIQAFLEKHGIEDETAIQEVISEWDSFMGRPIAQNTEKIWFNKHVLYIKMKSPAWRNELQLARIKIKTMINERVNKDLVKEVKII